MLTSTWLAKMVGAEEDAIAKPSFAANAPGALRRPTRMEAVAVNIMIERAMTTMTLRRIRRMEPPP
jgi:hypothetical protein